jgi:hypothetical protein
MNAQERLDREVIVYWQPEKSLGIGKAGSLRKFIATNDYALTLE